MRTQIVLLTIAAVCLTLNSPLLAAIRKVPIEYPTIQAAIDDCNDSDVVIVEPNTYTGTGNRDIDFKGKAITVRSIHPYDPNVVAATVIDCQGLGRGFYFHSGEDSNSVLDGLTVTNGIGDWDGGGIYCVGSSPTISRCVITGNKGKDGAYKAYEIGGSGGGIYCSVSSAILKECTIKNNITGAGSFDVEPAADSGDGGGIYCISSSLTIRDCIISNNRTNQGVDGYYNTISNSGSGGGIYCESSTLEITDSAVTSNAVLRGGQADFGQAKTGNGGGIYCISCPSVDISGCEISSNRIGNGTGSRWTCEPAGFGGGIYCGSSTIILTDSIINGNATGHGGSAHEAGGCDGGHGGAIYCTSSSTATVANCVISNNATGRGGSTAELNAGNGGDGAGIYCGVSCSVTLNNCCITGNITGSGGSVNWMGDGGDGGDGGGVFSASNLVVKIQNCTISANQTGAGGTGGPEGGLDGIYGIGAGACATTSTIITDTIVWSNSPDELAGHSCSKISHCDIGDGICVGGGINISTDPLFVTGPLGDYYLSQIAAGQAIDSPCVDAGSDTAVNLGMDLFTTRTDESTDEGTVDMGYHYPTTTVVFNPDIHENWQVDWFDYAILAADWQNCYEESYLPGDITMDTCVNGKDLKILVDFWLDCYVTKAFNPTPPNNTVEVNQNVQLIWMPGMGALYHDVYLGTDSNAVANAGHGSPEFMGTVSDPNFDPCGLEWETIYYWRINEVGPACTKQGEVWSFTTYSEPDPCLVGHWKFDEGSGTTAYDSAGTNNGTLIGDPTWTTGRFDGALGFDGDFDGDYVSVAPIVPLTGNTVTVQAWIFLIEYVGMGGPILTQKTDFNGYSFGAPGGKPFISITAGSSSVMAISPEVINEAQWYCVTGTNDGSNLKLYIDGQLKDSASSAGFSGVNNTALIGGELTPPMFFKGIIDDVRIYDRALTALEILKLYQDGLN